MYQSGLVPRRLTAPGLIGGPLICISGVAVMFGVTDQGGTEQLIATIPEFLWELGLGIYLTMKGFEPSPILKRAIRERLRSRRGINARRGGLCALQVRCSCRSPSTLLLRARFTLGWPRESMRVSSSRVHRTLRPFRCGRVAVAGPIGGRHD